MPFCPSEDYNQLQFNVNGIPPKGQMRPRFSTYGGFVHAYEKRDMVDYKRLIRYRVKDQIQEHYSGFSPFSCAIEVNITFLFLPPQSWSEKKKKEAYQRLIPKITKPDLDNLTKAVLDALNGVVWKDDNIIIRQVIEKWYADHDDIKIEVKKIEGLK